MRALFFFQDIGKDCAQEDRVVVLALPRRQLQPEKRQKHFPRAQGISSRASPTSLLLESLGGAPFSYLLPCSFLHYPKGLNHAFCQSVSLTISSSNLRAPFPLSTYNILT